MKIFAYEVRDDEKKAFERLAEEYGVELTISTDVPSLQNAGEVAGFDGITMLGQGNISRELLEAYKQAGIRFLSTGPSDTTTLI